MPRKLRIKTARRAQGFAPTITTSPLPMPEGAQQVPVHDLVGFLRNTLTESDRREVSDLLVSQRPFQRQYRPRPGCGVAGAIVVKSNGSDVAVEVQS